MIDIRVLDWKGYEFDNFFKFDFCGERVAFVPQITIDGRNQLQIDDPGLWIRYYLFDRDKANILAVCTVGPDKEGVPENMRVGENGLTADAIEILGLTNVYDKDSDTLPDNGVKYIGFEGFYDDGNGNPNLDHRIYGDGNYRWQDYPNINGGENGWLEEPVSITTGVANPYTFTIEKARPTVSFIGNVEEVEYDPNNPEAEYYASGYELAYANDYMNAFKNAIESRAVQLLIKKDGEPYIPVVRGSDPGEYVTDIRPGDLSIGQGDNPREDRYLWMNFDPIFKVTRQIKLVIKGEEFDQSGVSIPVSASKNYDGKLWAPEAKAPKGALIEYSTDGGNTWNESPAGIEDVGTIYVTVRITGLPGQQEDLYYYYYLQVLPRPIYVTSDSMSWNYDGSRKICDWVTVQGHYDEDSGSSRIQTRFEPNDPNNPRKIKGIPLIKSGDTMEIEFKGGQTEIGSSNNAFDFEVVSNKPNNYDVRVEFGLLKVNLNSEDIYVYIRGNTRGTGEDYESEKEKSCIYNGGFWTVSGYKVIAVDSHPDFLVKDSDNPNKFVPGSHYTPGMGDLWDTYNTKDIEFIGKETNAEVSGLYINNSRSWLSEEYVSELSDLDFKNNNSNFSNRNIHFIVTPNRLFISKREVTVSISGHTLEETFHMTLDETDNRYKPDWYSVSGFDASTEDEVYDVSDVEYSKTNPRDQKILDNPIAYGCIWNEQSGDGKWYMHLEEDIHEEESDKDEKWTGNGFINTNKNFEVTFEIALDEEDNPMDGWLMINPLDVEVTIRGTQDSVVYNGEIQSLIGTRSCPEIWWRSDCEFFNWEAVNEAINQDWVLRVIETVPRKSPADTEKMSDIGQLDRTSETPADTKSVSDEKSDITKRIVYYRVIHDMGYFECDDDGSAKGVSVGPNIKEINELVDPRDPNYYNSIPYMFGIDIDDFHEDETSNHNQFPNGDTPGWWMDGYRHIYYNFNVTFNLPEGNDGYRIIEPYNDEVKINITGHTKTSESADSVTGYDTVSDTNIYPVDYTSYIDGPEQSEARAEGDQPGIYMMGLKASDFHNINKNFTNVLFFISDGWLLVKGSLIDQDVTGSDSNNKVFDNTALEVVDPVGGGTLRRAVMTLDGQWMDVNSIERYDVGTMQFKIDSDKEHSDLSIGGTIKIEPLRLKITSKSRSFLYDGSSHELREVTIEVLNSNVSPDNMSAIRQFVNSITFKGWKNITDVGSIYNEFDIDFVPFAHGVENKLYSVNGQLRGEGIIGKGIVPNVIITTEYGVLEIIETLTDIEISGLEETVVYDGLLHSLTGYTCNPNVHISLKPGFEYIDSINKMDVGEYTMGLTADSFDVPGNVNVVLLNDGKLTIVPRPMMIKTGSDTGHWNDEDPAYTAENHSYSAINIASTDTVKILGDWPSLSTPGEIENSIDYDIIHESGYSVKNNYDIEEIWGLLRISESSKADMYYRIMGIRKDITGKDTNKVRIEGLKGIDYLAKLDIPGFKQGDRIVDEDRFYPILHKLVPIPEDGVVEFNDIICIVPIFKHSKRMEKVTWMFENKSTGEKIFSKVHNRIIFPDGNYGGIRPEINNGGLADTPVANVIPRDLKPGYYDVTVNYRMNGRDYSQKFSSVFMIKKR